MYVLAETEGTRPTGTIEDSVFARNTLDVREEVTPPEARASALVMSMATGASVDMSRNRFVGNTGGVVSTIVWFFRVTALNINLSFCGVVVEIR